MPKITLSVIKADVGSIGGHTKPSELMIKEVRSRLSGVVKEKKDNGFVIDGLVTHTGDDIAITISHEYGEGASNIHKFAWDCFIAATEEAKRAGLYGAGQDLLVDAPSGNIRGAGPAVAEIEFELLPKYRPAEAFLVFAADKCGPGAYSYPLYSAFCDPMHNGAILLSPTIHKGFTLTIIDMDAKDGDRIIKLDVPERIWDVAVLLRDQDRYAIESIHSRHIPGEHIASVSATRLHNIAGKYTGKDDPVALVRTQGIFPAPEIIISPWKLGHSVTGDAYGSHIMHIKPMPINTAVDDDHCGPIVSCLAFSLNKEGKFTEEYVDIFRGSSWDWTRQKVAQKNEELRRQGFFGSAMASHTELAYTGIVDTIAALDKEFKIRGT